MHGSVLIIDDNQDFLALVKTALRRKGCSIETAPSGEDALEVLRKIEPPDLVLLDVQMPDMSGPEFLDKLEETKDIACDKSTFVFCTAGTKPDDHRVKGCLNKMADLNDLIATVRDLLSNCPRLAASAAH